MQSLIHGNFEGGAQKRAYALVGAASGIAAAIGPLLGGFITTFLSWRVGFLLEVVVIALVLLGMGRIKDVPFTGERGIDFIGAGLSVLGMGGVVLGILAWQEGAEAVGILIATGLVALAGLGWWLVRRKRAGKLALLDPDLFKSPNFRLGISGQTLQQISLGGLMIALPMFLQMVLEYNALQAGISIAPLSLSMFFIALLAGRRLGSRRPSTVIRVGFALLTIGVLVIIPFVPRIDSGLWLAIPLIVAGSGLGLLLSQLNNYTLAPISEERISEAAGVNSAGGSFGLSFGLALAGGVMLAMLAFSFTNLAEQSTVLNETQQTEVAQALDEDAQLLSNSNLEAQLAGQPEDIQAEVIRINTEARPIALQAALLVPLLAGLLGLAVSFRMVRVGDIEPKVALEGLAFD
jgi:MFS family permease